MRGKMQAPDGWQVVRLGDVAEIAFSSVDKKTVDSEVPVELCNYTDVFYNRRIRPGMDFMTATARHKPVQDCASDGDFVYDPNSALELSAIARSQQTKSAFRPIVSGGLCPKSCVASHVRDWLDLMGFLYDGG